MTKCGLMLVSRCAHYITKAFWYLKYFPIKNFLPRFPSPPNWNKTTASSVNGLPLEAPWRGRRQCSALIPLPSMSVPDVSTLPDLRHILALGSAVFQRGGSLPTRKFSSEADCASCESVHGPARGHRLLWGVPTLSLIVTICGTHCEMWAPTREVHRA